MSRIGYFEVSLDEKHEALSVRIQFDDSRALFLIIERIRRMFDLSADWQPTGIGVHLQTGMLFGITTESCSASQRNRVHLRPDSPVITNPRYSVDRYAEDHTVVEHLPRGKYDLKVDLSAGEHGEYAEPFWFEVEVSEQGLKVNRLNQRPAFIE